LFQLSIIWLSSMAIIVLMYMIWNKTQEVGGLKECSPYIQKALKKLFVYPFILVICYLLVSYKNVSDIRFPHQSNYTAFFGNGADLMLCLQGFFTATAFWIGNQSIARLWYKNCFGPCLCCCCCCLPTSQDDCNADTSFITTEPTDARQSLNVPLLLNDTKFVEKYIPSSSVSFNSESRMQSSILSIFDFLASPSNIANDDNTTEESIQSNHSTTGHTGVITGNVNLFHHDVTSHDHEDDNAIRLSIK